ncbi:MAG TPA: phage holin family protein [Caulobacteraceae bacterium]|nr:phage holin family protein [Caulobacteraceae bacterium]
MTETRTLPELFSLLVNDLSDLVRKESSLVRAEVSEKLGQTLRAGAWLAAGAALLLGAFLVLLQALVLALGKVMDPLWASILVGVAVGVAGYLLIHAALKSIQPAALVPDRSARQIKKDIRVGRGDVGYMKEQVQ